MSNRGPGPLEMFFLIIIRDNYTLLIPLNGHFIQWQGDKMEKVKRKKNFAQSSFVWITHIQIHTRS